MDQNYSITIGTCGRGTWNSGDGGESWMLQRKWFFPPESPIVRALTLHPTDPHTLYAGADKGIHRSTDNGRSWEMINNSDNIKNVWALAIDPTDPNIMFAGTSPTGLCRSRDAGHTWETLSLPPLATECEVGDPRVTFIAIDADDSNIIWAGIEVDGILLSLDGGDNWNRVSSIPDDDIHCMLINKSNGSQVLALTPRDLYVSTDMGEVWEPMGMDLYRSANKDAHYMRWITPKPDDPNILFLGCGNFNVGDTGSLFKSTDCGKTWRKLTLPTPSTNSTVFGIATNAAMPDRVAACTVNGEVWISEDVGESWRRVQQIFGEILCIALQPNSQEKPMIYNASGTQALLGGEIQRPT